MKGATLIALAMLVLAGCGGGAAGSPAPATPSPSPGEPTSGDRLTADKAAGIIYGVSSTVPNGNGVVGAILTNHSKRHVATSILVQATAYGANNTVVGSSSGGSFNRIPLVHAGQSLPAAISISMNAGGPISRVSVHTAVGAWFEDTNPKGRISGRDLAVSSLGYSDEFNLTATITNSYPRELQSALVYGICKDRGGKINAAGSGQVDILPANGEAGKTVLMFGQMPESPSTCQVAGAPGSPLEGG